MPSTTRSITAYLEDVAQKRPNKLAVVEPRGRKVTFCELDKQTAAIAGGLRALGVQSGDRLLLLVPMCIPLYLALIALFRGHHTAVLLDPSAPRVNDTLSSIGLRGFIGTPAAQLLRLKMPSLRGLGLHISTGFTLLPHRRLEGLGGPVPDLGDPPADLPALLTFTTGSTGTPKAVARTHGFLDAQHRILRRHMQLGPDDVDLPTLPVFLLNSLASGATCVLPDADLRAVGNVRPERVVRQLLDWRCTVGSGSPAFFGPIGQHLRKCGATLPTLRRLYVGGARVPPQALRDLLLAAPNAQIEVIYGSTEAEPIAALDARVVIEETAAAEAKGKGSCVGYAIPGTDVRVVVPGDGANPLPQGVIGEILVAGEHVNKGYYRNPEADAKNKVAADGRTWHRTGDTGYFDAHNRIWLVGRVKDMVGERHPFMVEGVAESFSWVRRAALVDHEGAAVLACALRQRPKNWADILQERTQVDRVIDVPNIPVDPRHNAKVDRASARLAVAKRLDERH